MGEGDRDNDRQIYRQTDTERVMWEEDKEI